MDTQPDEIKCAQCQIVWKDANFPEDSDLQSWAQFNGYDSNVFQYGLQGMFVLESERIFSEGDYLCCTCLSQYHHSPYVTIKCANCSKLYQNAYYNEAFECATNVLENSLIPGYGSKYDMQQLTFANDKVPAHLPKDQPNETLVCDSCIDQWIADGVIEFTQSPQSQGMILKLGPVPSNN